MIPFLRIAVIVMGVLIVAGIAVIGVKIYQDSNKLAETLNADSVDSPATQPTSPHYRTSLEQLNLGAGVVLQSMTAEDDRLLLRVRTADAHERLVIINMKNGAVVGEIALPPSGE